MTRSLAPLALAALLVTDAACSSSRSPAALRAAHRLLAHARGTSVFGPPEQFLGSELSEVGTSGLFPVRPPEACEVSILPGGEDSFAARMALLSRAQRTIRIQALIFTGDEAGLRVAEVLKQKQRQGVDVKVIVDGASNVAVQTQWMYFDLKQHGIQIEGYEPAGLQLINEVSLPLDGSRYDPLAPNKRYHEKLWLVDADTPGAEAIVGGLNIANEYFRVDPGNVPRYWRDQDVLVRGAVLADLTATFERNWTHFKEIKARRGGVTDAAWEVMRAILARTGTTDISFRRRADLVRSVAALEARVVPRDFQPTQCRFFQNRPRLGESYILQAYLKLLDMARREVLIANAYFLPTAATSMAIREAARRCVRVVVMTNSAETNDTPGLTMLGRGYYRELLAVNATAPVKACPNPDAGVEIWEWQGRGPGDARRTQGLMHAKFAVVDRRLSLVGSHNLDPRSERLNSEDVLVYESPDLAEQLARRFLEHDLAASRRITAAEAAAFERPASVLHRLKLGFAQLFEDQL
ncbi:MAG TPA: phosphatidylserine/phosphatidylglycerophosphate/cardiolipin synthase family protein [Kofleriaceae bacterium]|nr:phosphatidylserine/phosphatidylglycerophosphate/cardiolipin synthase family protein [Kofleriaceae bacterium]